MKIAFVGASGYGNVGDDTYPLVFRQHLAEHELVFFNSDLPPDLPSDIRLLVLGGGGILYNSRMEPPAAESPHCARMKFYLERAKALGIPWGISSCGFQFAQGQDWRNPAALEPWRPWLSEARFLTLRSPVCARIAAQLTGRTDCHFFPDAAYLFAGKNPKPRKPKPALTIVPAGVINPVNHLARHFIKLFASLGWQQVWLSMGSAMDDDMLMVDAVREYPDARIIRRSSPAAAWEQIAASSFVLTGRYHGMVFARSCGIPFFVPESSPHKIVHEDFTADPAAAIGHVEVLRREIAAIGG